MQALIRTAHARGYATPVLDAVEARNAAQKQVLFQKLSRRFGSDLRGHTFAVWGLAFKPGTDDLREAPARVLIEALLNAGASVRAYDPVAMDAARKEWPAAWFEAGRLSLAAHQYEALEGADALVLVTEWKPFRHPDFAAMKRLLKAPIILDGRNQYDPEELQPLGFEYEGIGRGLALPSVKDFTGSLARR